MLLQWKLPMLQVSVPLLDSIILWGGGGGGGKFKGHPKEDHFFYYLPQ